MVRVNFKKLMQGVNQGLSVLLDCIYVIVVFII
jgi:hypothetical protein